MGEVKAIHWSLRSLLEALKTIFRCFILIPPFVYCGWVENTSWAQRNYMMAAVSLGTTREWERGWQWTKLKGFKPTAHLESQNLERQRLHLQFKQPANTCREYPGLTMRSPSRWQVCALPWTNDLIKICGGSIGIIVCKDLSLCDLLSELLK